MLRPKPEERVKLPSLLHSLGLTPYSSSSDSATVQSSSSSFSSSASSSSQSFSLAPSSSFEDLGKWMESGLASGLSKSSACESPLVLKRVSPRTPLRKLPMGRGRRLRSLNSTLHYLK